MNLRKFISFCTLLFVLGSCEYVPTGTNVHNVSIPPGNINILVLNENQINVLRGFVRISYQSILNGHTLKAVQLYLDTLFVGTSYADSGYVSFQTSNFKDSNYVLRVVLITATNSGSLADRLGSEIFYTYKEYPVTLFNAPIHQPEVLMLKAENGAMTVTWKKYTQLGFEKYLIIRNGQTLAELTDVNQTRYSDTTFLGGYASYQICLYAFGYQLYSWSKQIDQKPLFASSEVINDNKIRLHWFKWPLYPSFGSYIIVRHDREPYPIIANINDINETTFVDESPPLAYSSFYRLIVKSKSGLIIQSYDIRYAPPLGVPCNYQNGGRFEYISQRNLYYQFSQSTSSLIDGNTFSTMYSNRTDQEPSWIRYGGDMSTNGEYVYVMSARNYKIIKKLNKTNLALEKTIDFTSVFPSSSIHFENTYLGVSNNNMVITVTHEEYTSINVLRIYDMNSITQKASLIIRPQPYDSWIDISDDGKYILTSDNLFSFQDTTIKLIGIVLRPSAFAKDNNYLVRANGRTLQLLRCSDLQVVKSVPIDMDITNGKISVDRTTGLVGIEANWGSVYEVYDMETGEKRGSLPMVGIGFTFQNGLLFGHGRAVTIKLN